MNTEVVPTGRIANWWRRWFRASSATADEDPLSNALQRHEPLVIAREQETPVIKARILSGLLSRRLDVCRGELFSEPPGFPARIVPMPGLARLYNTMTPQPDALPLVEQEPQPTYSPKPASADSPFWLDDTDPSPSPSPSPDPGP